MTVYVNNNPRTKKELKSWIKEGRLLGVFNAGPWPVTANGDEVVSGPHYPKPHTWYATVTLENGIIVKVR